jgi:hypothetical protein
VVIRHPFSTILAPLPELQAFATCSRHREHFRYHLTPLSSFKIMWALLRPPCGLRRILVDVKRHFGQPLHLPGDLLLQGLPFCLIPEASTFVGGRPRSIQCRSCYFNLMIPFVSHLVLVCLSATVIPALLRCQLLLELWPLSLPHFSGLCGVRDRDRLSCPGARLDRDRSM